MNNYNIIKVEFDRYHRHPLNILIHAITTPLCTVFFINIIEQLLSGFFNYFCLFYFTLLSILLSNQKKLLCYTTITNIIEYSLSKNNMSITHNFLFFSLFYLFQDFSHWLTDEKTYQSSYIQSKSPFIRKLEKLFLHSIYLNTLVIESVISQSFFVEFFVQKNFIIQNKEIKEASQYSQLFREWIHNNTKLSNSTTHVFEKDMVELKIPWSCISNLVKRELREIFNHEVYDIVSNNDMNELYISADTWSNNSDKIFYMEHIDGPFWFIPCFTYRCLFGLTENTMVRTSFPVDREQYVLGENGVIGFDYNRTIHKIDHSGEKNKIRRSVLKLHYTIYPRGYKRLAIISKKLNTMYNTWARGNFVKALNPDSTLVKLNAFSIIISTFMFRVTEQYIGFNNILFLCFLSLIDGNISGTWFYYTSFIHYIYYITTFHYIKNNKISYDLFKRDVILYKTLSVINLLNLVYHKYIFSIFELVVILIGQIVSFIAFIKVGSDKTYFGIEYGITSDKTLVKTFPYNVISHPMTLGQVVSLFVLYTKDYEFVFVVHILLYIIHTVQEHFN